MSHHPLKGLGMRPARVALACAVLAGLAPAPATAAISQLADSTASVGANGQRASGRLVIGGGSVGHVRFDLTPLVSPLARASLSLYIRRGGRGLTVGGRPGGMLSARRGRLRAGQRYEFDVTAAIRRSGGSHLFVLTSRAGSRITVGAGGSVASSLRPRLRIWLDKPPRRARPKSGAPVPGGPSAAARRQLLDALGSVREATGYRYGAEDHLGNRLDTLKVIQIGKSRYLGVYHALIDGKFTVMVATSRNLLDWRYRAVLAGSSSQPTIARLRNGSFVVAYEYNDPTGIGIRFRHYRDLKSLLEGRYGRQFTAPSTLSPVAQGTPNIYGASLQHGIGNSRIRIGLHYFRAGRVDRQATGLLRDFSLWHARRQPFLDRRPVSLGARGHIGDRDHIAFQGYDFNVHETEIVPGDWSSWRTYLYDFRARSAYPLLVQTHGGSFAFGNPTVSEVRSPSGKRALVMTQFMFHEGAVPGEAGQLIYYRELE